MRLGDVPPGSIFRTAEGVLALKTEYHSFDNCTQCDCYLLASGEAAHFFGKDEADVELVQLSDAVAEQSGLGKEEEKKSESQDWISLENRCKRTKKTLARISDISRQLPDSELEAGWRLGMVYALAERALDDGDKKS